MAGLFDTFTTGKRGLNVMQGAINTTSHNIANANTKGYSRQRAISETTRPFGGMSRFDTCSVGQIGTGAEISSIQRIRDSFIDYQVRSESGTEGYYSAKSDVLYKVEDIFGEPSDKGIQELMSQFYSAFQEVSKSPNKSDVKAVAIQKASALADSINYTYNQLKKTCDDSQKVLQTYVTDINSYLDQINELNKQIRGVSAIGQTPNDLMDKRDNLLDKISSKFGVKIDKDKLETINLSSTEYPNNALVKSDPNDVSYNRFSYIKSATAVKDASGILTGEVEVEYYPLGDENAPIKSFKVSVDDTTDPVQKEKNIQDLINNMTQNRILMADKDGNVVRTTSKTIDETEVKVNEDNTLEIKVVNGDTITTKIDGSIEIKDKDGTVITPSPTPMIPTIITTTTPNIKISVDATSGKTKIETLKADGTVATTTEMKDGMITSNPTEKDIKKVIVKTYEYDRENNSVDDKYVKGEIAGNQAVQATIKGYMDNLDRLAAGLAYTVNAIQTGSVTDGNTSQGLKDNLIFVNNGTTRADGVSLTDTGINASNIKINSALLKDSTLLNCNTTSTSGEGDGKRANAIANLNGLKMNLGNISDDEDLSKMDRKTFLEKIGIDTSDASKAGFSDDNCLNLNPAKDGSTTDSYYKTLINNLAVVTQESGRQVDNQEVILANLQQQKLSVSGVSIDEEVTDLIKFQHAYQANARVISTINELLDVVINGLKR